MDHLLSLAIVACFLFAATIIVHFESLLIISRIEAHSIKLGRGNLLLTMYGALTAHILEIAIYAAGYWFVDVVVGAGNLSGKSVLHALDYFYFSAEAYTSLGVGNLYPVGDVRLLAGLETLNGLLMLGWTTSFTYLGMRRYWE